MADKRQFTQNNERSPLPDRFPAKPTPTANAWRLSPRHLITAAGGFLSALGIAFTVIAQTRLAVALMLGGLFILAVGLAPQVGRIAAKVIDKIGTAMQEAARRRLKAKELDLQKQWIDLETARLAQQDRALDRLLPAEPVSQPQASSEEVVR